MNGHGAATIIESIAGALGAVAGAEAQTVLSDDVADVLWLAQHCDRLAEHLPTCWSSPETTPRTPPADTAAEALAASPAAADPDRAPQPARTGRDVFLSGQSGVNGQSGVTGQGTRAMAATRLPIPRAAALPECLAIGRSLRPLRIRRPSTRRFMVDETLTATQAAQIEDWQPVCRPELERWPDLAFVVDGAASMVIWHETAGGLLTLLRRLGAFRETRCWLLSRDDHGASTVTQGMAAGAASDARAPRPALETLRDPTGRRLVLVITDGTDRAWGDGGHASWLRQLAITNPVMVVSLVPQWLWPPDGLRVTPGQVRLDAPMLPNHRWSRKTKGPGVAIPVCDLAPWRMARYADVLAGGQRWATLRLLDAQPAPPRPRSGRSGGPSFVDRMDALVGRPREYPEEIADFLRSRLGPPAFRLLAHLAALPLTLGFIRLVQERGSILPDTATMTLAEVLLSGVLEPLDDGADDQLFRFRHEAVRRALADRLAPDSRAELADRLREYIEERSDRPTGLLKAIMHDPDDPETLHAFATECGPIATVRRRPGHGGHGGSRVDTPTWMLCTIVGRVPPMRRIKARQLARSYARHPRGPLVLLTDEHLAGDDGQRVVRLRKAIATAGAGALHLDAADQIFQHEATRCEVDRLLEQAGDDGPEMIILSWREGDGGARFRVPDKPGRQPTLAKVPLKGTRLPATRCYEHVTSVLRGLVPRWTSDFEDRLWQCLSGADTMLSQKRRGDLPSYAQETAREVVGRWRGRGGANNHLPVDVGDIPPELDRYA